MVNHNIDNVSIKKINSTTWEISYMNSGLRYSYWTDDPQVKEIVNELTKGRSWIYGGSSTAVQTDSDTGGH
jgi:hypothetical protein